MDKNDEILKKINVTLENLAVEVSKLTDRVSKLEQTDNILIKPNAESDIISKIKPHFEKITLQHLVIIALKIQPKQTKDQLIDLVESWGAPIKIWFKSSHFKNRLLDKGIVMIVNTDNGNDVFSLSHLKGNKLANTLIEKYSS